VQISHELKLTNKANCVEIERFLIYRHTIDNGHFLSSNVQVNTEDKK